MRATLAASGQRWGRRSRPCAAGRATAARARRCCALQRAAGRSGELLRRAGGPQGLLATPVASPTAARSRKPRRRARDDESCAPKATARCKAHSVQWQATPTRHNRRDYRSIATRYYGYIRSLAVTLTVPSGVGVAARNMQTMFIQPACIQRARRSGRCDDAVRQQCVPYHDHACGLVRTLSRRCGDWTRPRKPSVLYGVERLNPVTA